MAAVLPPNAQTFWNALQAAGASAVQSAAIIGNAMNESGLNPDEVAMDSNGAYSRGLLMWNDQGAGRGVNWSQYITGNTANDISAQVSLIKAQGGFAKASGADVTSAAENFANQFEACAECGYPGQPGFSGSAQLAPRAANAIKVYQVAQSGNWGLGGTLAPLNQSLPATQDPGSSVQTTGFNLNPLHDWDQIFKDMGGAVAGAEKFYTGATRFFAMLVSGETWIRLGEVGLGVLLGSAGIALVAVTIAGENPQLVTTLASLIPGEGEAVGVASGVARGAATSAATGSAARTVAGGLAGGQRVRASATRRTARRPPAPTIAQANRQAAATVRKATPAPTPAKPRKTKVPGTRAGSGAEAYALEYKRRARQREREKRLERQWGAPAGSDEDYEEHRGSARENRAAYRRHMGPPPRNRRRDADRSDLRRRTS